MTELREDRKLITIVFTFKKLLRTNLYERDIKEYKRKAIHKKAV
jgi:hypothetical protein